MRIHYLKVREQSSKSKMSLKKEYQVLIQNHINFENGTLELKVHVLVGARDRQYIEKNVLCLQIQWPCVDRLTNHSELLCIILEQVDSIGI